MGATDGALCPRLPRGLPVSRWLPVDQRDPISADPISADPDAEATPQPVVVIRSSVAELKDNATGSRV